jgi:hypothetical protein
MYDSNFYRWQNDCDVQAARLQRKQVNCLSIKRSLRSDPVVFKVFKFFSFVKTLRFSVLIT